MRCSEEDDTEGKAKRFLLLCSINPYQVINFIKLYKLIKTDNKFLELGNSVNMLETG